MNSVRTLVLCWESPNVRLKSDRLSGIAFPHPLDRIQDSEQRRTNPARSDLVHRAVRPSAPTSQATTIRIEALQIRLRRSVAEPLAAPAACPSCLGKREAGATLNE